MDTVEGPSLYQPQFPERWPRRSLYSLATWVNGIAFRDIQFAASGKPVIKIAEVKDGLSPQTRFTVQTFDPSVHIAAGDMIFSWSGQPETSIDVFWWRGVDGWLNQHLFKVTPRDGIDPFFFYYLLRHLRPHFVAIARNKQTTGLGHVTRRDLEAIQVGVPSLGEQREIGVVLGAFDDKIELNRRMSQTLESIARALFKSWFVDFDPVRAKAEGRDPGLPKRLAALFPSSFADSALGQVPEGWRVGVLNDLSEALIGGDWGADEPTARETELALCIRGADIPDLQGGGTGKMPTRYLRAASLQKRRLIDGDLVVEVSGGSPTQSTGRAVLVTGPLLDRLARPVCCSNFCREVRLKSPEASTYAYLLLRWLYDTGEFLGFENGTTGIKNFDIALFFEIFPILLPPAPILEAFQSLTATASIRRQASGACADALVALRSRLLPKLVGGESVIPAAVSEAAR